MDKDKLLPCPFCNRNNLVINRQAPLQFVYAVYCKDCEYAGPPGRKDNCEELWNTRSDKAHGQVENLAEDYI